MLNLAGRIARSPRGGWYSHLLSFACGIVICHIAIHFTSYLQSSRRFDACGLHHLQAGEDRQERHDNAGDIDKQAASGEDYSVAYDLKTKVRVLCWVMTNPGNLQRKAVHVNATWGRRCNILLFMSSAPSNLSIPVVGLNVTEGRDHLWSKVKAAFVYMYKNHLNDAEWFFRADDDTYAIIENLRYLLKDLDPNDPIHMGRRFKPFTKQGYMSGGGGYVLSREAVKLFVTKAIPDTSICREADTWTDDVQIGICLENVGVKVVDSRDEIGQQRFHSLPPHSLLMDGAIEKSFWLWSYDYYPLQNNLECCSNYTITFHYATPDFMHVLDYLIYNMKVFGIARNYSPQLGMDRAKGESSENSSGSGIIPEPGNKLDKTSPESLPITP